MCCQSSETKGGQEIRAQNGSGPKRWMRCVKAAQNGTHPTESLSQIQTGVNVRAAPRWSAATPVPLACKTVLHLGATPWC